jgi:hypothetical protein
MNMKEIFKDTLRFMIIWSVVNAIVMVGFYGIFLSMDDQTTTGWRSWGVLLALLIVAIPVSQFWMKQLYNLFNIED